MVGAGAFTPNADYITSSILNTSDSSTEEVFCTRYNFNASLSSAVYNNSTTVQPPSLVLNYMIKY